MCYLIVLFTNILLFRSSWVALQGLSRSEKMPFIKVLGLSSTSAERAIHGHQHFEPTPGKPGNLEH